LGLLQFLDIQMRCRVWFRDFGQGLGFRTQGLGFLGLEFRVLGPNLLKILHVQKRVDR